MKLGQGVLHWETIWQIAKTDFKLRYQGSILGLLWSLLKPLSLLFVLNLVFTQLFKLTTPHYSLQLFVGLVLWNFFLENTMAGISSLVNRAGLLTKQPVPKWIVILSSSLTGLISFLFQLVILSIFFGLDHVVPTATDVGWFFVIVLLEFGLILSINLFFAPLFVRLRDIVQVWEVGLMAGFYMIPIIYPIDLIPASIQPLLLINPLARIIQQAKETLIFDTSMDWTALGITVGFVAGLMAVSIICFRNFSRTVNEHL